MEVEIDDPEYFSTMGTISLKHTYLMDVLDPPHLMYLPIHYFKCLGDVPHCLIFHVPCFKYIWSVLKILRVWKIQSIVLRCAQIAIHFVLSNSVSIVFGCMSNVNMLHVWTDGIPRSFRASIIHMYPILLTPV